MIKEFINPQSLSNWEQTFTQVITVSAVKPVKTLYISGQVAVDQDQNLIGAGDLGAQAIQAFRKCDFYARRLFDDEFCWFSGEYEIVSAAPLDVRGTIARIASEIGAQVMDIDRRFHKRLVVPLGY